VATRGQADVALRNRRFLSQDGRLITVIKARSEDVTAAPADVFSRATTELATEYKLLETQRLEPYHDDHLAVIATPE
jgi:fibrillarin-like pre-rRNA processing protein